MSFETPRGGEPFDWEGAWDLTSLPEENLRELLGALSEEERAAEYRLEVLRGRMDLVRAELAGRDTAALPPEDLARVLMGEIGGPEDLGSPPGGAPGGAPGGTSGGPGGRF